MQENLKNFIQGISILGSHSAGNHFDMDSCHDMLIFAPDVGEDDIPEDEKSILVKCGFHFSKEFRCWAFFT